MKKPLLFLLCLSLHAAEHHAILDANGVVQQVIVITAQEAANNGAAHLANLRLSNTSIFQQCRDPYDKNDSTGVRYPAIGDKFAKLPVKGDMAFIAPAKYLDWTLNEEKAVFEPPKPMPADASFQKPYYWTKTDSIKEGDWTTDKTKESPPDNAFPNSIQAKSLRNPQSDNRGIVATLVILAVGAAGYGIKKIRNKGEKSALLITITAAYAMGSGVAEAAKARAPAFNYCTISINYVVHQGGGAGSTGTTGTNFGAGGGAGTRVAGTFTASVASWTVTIGAGAANTSTANAQAGGNGSDSSITGVATATSSNGAGTGRTGGSNADFSGSTDSTSTEAGGGAGSGASATASGRDGGAGYTWTIDGVQRGGGGGCGGSIFGIVYGNGGAGGGGDGGFDTNNGGHMPVIGAANTGSGGGGGGAGGLGAYGGAGGGSGFAKFASLLSDSVTATDGTTSTDATYAYNAFTTSGTYQITAVGGATRQPRPPGGAQFGGMVWNQYDVWNERRAA